MTIPSRTALLALALATCAGAAAAPPTQTSTHARQVLPAAANRRSEDFDFLRGDWCVHNRRLTRVLRHANEWTDFSARHHGAPLMDGLANHDELRLDDGTLLGMSFCTFDRATRQWSIRWVAERDGLLQPALVGHFVDGVGTFEGDDVLDGRSIRVRYTWTGTTTANPRWQQAFSADAGRTWETNWTMEFRRPSTR